MQIRETLGLLICLPVLPDKVGDCGEYYEPYENWRFVYVHVATHSTLKSWEGDLVHAVK
jgi:uncharacterized membrane protein (DUF4010 family)